MEAPGHEVCLEKCRVLLNLPVDESKPYQQHYDAAELIQQELSKIKEGMPDDSSASAWLKVQVLSLYHNKPHDCA